VNTSTPRLTNSSDPVKNNARNQAAMLLGVARLVARLEHVHLALMSSDVAASVCFAAKALKPPQLQCVDI
jgi:hypothetical protein